MPKVDVHETPLAPEGSDRTLGLVRGTVRFLTEELARAHTDEEADAFGKAVNSLWWTDLQH